MKVRDKAGPPKWIARTLRAVLNADDADMVVNDLAELYARRLSTEGRARADRWYLRQAIGCAFHLRLDGIIRQKPYGSDGSSRSASYRITRAFVELPRDIRLAARSLMRRPAYATTVGLTLALGLSGLALVYSVAYWVLLRPVPGVTAPDELAVVQLEFDSGGGPFDGAFPISHVDAVDLTARAKHLATFTASSAQEIHFGAAGAANAERIAGEVVWPNYFEVLGTRMQYGRTLRADSMQPVVVLSDRLAHRFWSRTRDAVGATVFINGTSYTVTGVAPAEFHGTKLPGVADVWLPSTMLPSISHTPSIMQDGMAQVWTSIIARRKPNVDGPRIADAMNSAIPLIRASKRPSSFMPVVHLHGYDGIGLPASQRAAVAHTLRIVGLAALALLLLTCANVANLGLTHSASTSSNTAVRRALGASATRILRERLLESLVLGSAGAVLSIGIAAAGLRLLRATALSKTGISLEGIHLQTWVIVASVATALAAALLAGVVPAFLATRERGAMLLQTSRHGTVRAHRIRAMLVVAQVALSIVLVVWSGLLARTTWNLRHVDFGFNTSNVTQFSLDPEMQSYDEARTTSFIRELVNRLESQPGIASAAIMDHGVFDKFTFAASLKADPSQAEARQQHVYTRRVQMSPALLDVLGIPLVAGRVFNADWLTRDTAAVHVGMLSESALRKFMPGVTPDQAIGRTIMVNERKEIPVLITGITRDARISDIEGREPLAFYQPWSQGWKTGQLTVFVRARDRRVDVAGAVRSVVRSLDPTLPVYGLHTLAEEVDNQIAEQRFVANLAIALAATGMALAMLGLYGTLSYMVVERTREIGVRAALGARPATLISRVVENGLVLATIGVVIGVGVSLYLSYFIASRLYGITPFDGTTYVAGMLVLFVIAAMASAIPARRAAGIDPMQALRQE